jgi:hypothetical protein
MDITVIIAIVTSTVVTKLDGLGSSVMSVNHLHHNWSAAPHATHPLTENRARFGWTGGVDSHGGRSCAATVEDAVRGRRGLIRFGGFKKTRLMFHGGQGMWLRHSIVEMVQAPNATKSTLASAKIQFWCYKMGWFFKTYFWLGHLFAH